MLYRNTYRRAIAAMLGEYAPKKREMMIKYSFVEDGKEIGAVTSKIEGLGYNFCWKMFPLQYARARKDSALIKSEEGDVLSMRAFEDIVDASRYQFYSRDI